MLARRTLTALAIAGTLLIAGCSDDGDDAGSDDGAPAADDGGTSGGDALTTDDRDAFLAALTAGTAEGEDYIMCVAGEVKAAVDAGDFTAQDVRDWTGGEQLDTPLHEFITSPDVVTGCYAAINSTTTAAG